MIVLMRRLSDSMEEATVVRWLKSDGEPVERRDELVEIETDKATMTDDAEASAVLRAESYRKAKRAASASRLPSYCPRAPTAAPHPPPDT